MPKTTGSASVVIRISTPSGKIQRPSKGGPNLFNCSAMNGPAPQDHVHLCFSVLLTYSSFSVWQKLAHSSNPIEMKSLGWSFPTFMSFDYSSIKYFLFCAFVAFGLYIYFSRYHIVLIDMSIPDSSVKYFRRSPTPFILY